MTSIIEICVLGTRNMTKIGRRKPLSGAIAAIQAGNAAGCTLLVENSNHLCKRCVGPRVS